MESPYRLTSDRFRPDLHAEKNPSPPFSFRNRIESPPRSTFSDRSPPNRPAVRPSDTRPSGPESASVPPALSRDYRFDGQSRPGFPE